MNVLVLAPFNGQQIDDIRVAAGEGAVVSQHVQGLQGEQLAAALAQADVVIGEPDAEVLAKAEGIKLVQMTWAGADRYTKNAEIFPKGTALCNAVGGFGHIISQHVVGQILSITMNLAGYRDLQKRGVWGDLGGNMSLEGAKVLIFGAGSIGGDCAKRLSGFDCASITGVCRNTATPRDYFDALVTLDEAEGLLSSSDIVICALPSTAETARFLDERRLRLMKTGGVLVNVGRGDFIDNDALAVVLNDGHLRGAALDVTAPEPLPEGHALWATDSCLITPHVSGGSFRHAGTAARICAIACDNLRRLNAGEELVNRVL